MIEFTRPEMANAIIYTGLPWEGMVHTCQLYDRSCRIKQCVRYYDYGHIGTQCSAPQTCGHCAGRHESRACHARMNPGFQPKCTVCKGNHSMERCLPGKTKIDAASGEGETATEPLLASTTKESDIDHKPSGWTRVRTLFVQFHRRASLDDGPEDAIWRERRGTGVAGSANNNDDTRDSECKRRYPFMKDDNQILKILQYNTQKSREVMAEAFRRHQIYDYDIIAVQEPYRNTVTPSRIRAITQPKIVSISCTTTAS